MIEYIVRFIVSGILKSLQCEICANELQNKFITISKKKNRVDLTMASQGVLKLCQVAEAVEGVNGIQFNNMAIDKLTVKTFSKKYILNNVL